MAIFNTVFKDILKTNEIKIAQYLENLVEHTESMKALTVLLDDNEHKDELAKIIYLCANNIISIYDFPNVSFSKESIATIEDLIMYHEGLYTERFGVKHTNEYKYMDFRENALETKYGRSGTYSHDSNLEDEYKTFEGNVDSIIDYINFKYNVDEYDRASLFMYVNESDMVIEKYASLFEYILNSDFYNIKLNDATDAINIGEGIITSYQHRMIESDYNDILSDYNDRLMEIRYRILRR